METQIDLLPYFNDLSKKWEVQETNIIGNVVLEVYEFDEESDAFLFIENWIRDL